MSLELKANEGEVRVCACYAVLVVGSHVGNAKIRFETRELL
jgi:hypothetical protein